MDVSDFRFLHWLSKNSQDFCIHSFSGETAWKKNVWEIDISFKISETASQSIVNWKNIDDFKEFIVAALNPKPDPDNTYFEEMQSLVQNIIKTEALKLLKQNKEELETILSDID